MELRAETSVFDDKLLKEDIDNAQETADNAQVIAGTTAQYFWFLEEIGSVPAGVGTGAHITNLTKEAFLNNPANGGGNLLARSNGIAIRDGLTELAYFSGTAAQIGKSNGYNSYFDAQSFQIRDGSALLSKFTSNGTDIYLIDDSTHSVASFGATARIGKEEDSNIVVTSASIVGNSGNNDYFDINNNGGQITTTTYRTTSSYGGTGAVTINLATSNIFASMWNTIVNGGAFRVRIVYKYRVQIGTNKYTHQTKTVVVSFTKGTASTSNTYATYNGTNSLTLTSSYPAVSGGTYLGRNSVALGKAETTATPLYRFGYEVAETGGAYGFIVGHGTATFEAYQLACGEYNADYHDAYFMVGNGSSDSARSNAFVVDKYSNVLVGGTIVHTSDRRLKKHISYLDNDAVDFVDKLKPVYFTKDGKKQVGFYAQDVAEIDKWKCMIGNDLNGYMTLNYEELIAPLVTYVQKLEKRIKELERR